MEQEKETITLIAPSGAEKVEKYHPHDSVSKTLSHAVKEFGKNGQLNPNLEYQLVLNGTALEGSMTLEKAGVKPGDRLSIRSKATPTDGYAPRLF